ncbi:MAG: hypothetical protein H3C51_02580 [Rubellimicrobium sp.]|nr:hypothetical protein [Rubellimicrobium sp.]
MTAGGIAGLRRVTATHLAAAEARLAALQQREKAIIARLAALDAAYCRRAAERTAEDVALRAGVDLRWETWGETHRRALQGAQARLRVVQEHERAALRRAFGRDMVVAELAAQSLRAAQRTAARRAASGE